MSAVAEGCVGTGTTAIEVVDGRESEVFVEDLAYCLMEQLYVFLRDGVDVTHGIASQTEGGVVVLYTCMLDEEQGGGDLR